MRTKQEIAHKIAEFKKVQGILEEMRLKSIEYMEQNPGSFCTPPTWRSKTTNEIQSMIDTLKWILGAKDVW